ncbi:MAG: hypothetical protein AAF242_18675, partial [Bacteroidota bacterium]
MAFLWVQASKYSKLSLEEPCDYSQKISSKLSPDQSSKIGQWCAPKQPKGGDTNIGRDNIGGDQINYYGYRQK